MGLFSGRPVSARGRTLDAKRKAAERERWRQRKLAEGARQRSGESERDTRKVLDEFKAACQRGEWDKAPMSLWYGVRDASPDGMAGWLDANPGFIPPHGTHIGPPGTEPWRPVVRCQCGAAHRYGSADHNAYR